MIDPKFNVDRTRVGDWPPIKQAAREATEKSRREQGLPPTVEDPMTLRKIAKLVPNPPYGAD